jgi:hypothetical protein
VARFKRIGPPGMARGGPLLTLGRPLVRVWPRGAPVLEKSGDYLTCHRSAVRNWVRCQDPKNLRTAKYCLAHRPEHRHRSSPVFIGGDESAMMPTDHLFPKGAATMRNSQPMIASTLELSPCAVSVLGQLFVEGATLDDNITSKAGRCDLVSAGLAFHEAGLSSLTPDGVRLASEWDLCSLYARRDRRWYFKVRTNTRSEGAAVSHSEAGAAVR